MPTVAESFLESICRDPADDTPRLIYADYLDDHGQSDRAVFIRSQVEYANLPAICQKTGEIREEEIRSPRFYTKRCRCQVCSLRRKAYYSARRWIVWEWTADIRRVITPDEQAIRALIARPAEDFIPFISYSWRRGFICSIRTSEKDWLAHGEKLIRLAPLEQVDLMDKTPVFYGHGGHLFRWYEGDATGHGPFNISPSLWKMLGGRQKKTALGYRHKGYMTNTGAIIDLRINAVRLFRKRLGWPIAVIKEEKT